MAPDMGMCHVLWGDTGDPNVGGFLSMCRFHLLGAPVDASAVLARGR